VVPDAPIIFSEVPDCVIATDEPVVFDSAVFLAIDYESELAVITGVGGRGIPRAHAMEHVWDHTVVNDVTARDV
jgi:2-keto-4-pentenoate hydratase/2-oxohepta-3-ene-1,7-dioic acid hydratase in catechol pathway